MPLTERARCTVGPRSFDSRVGLRAVADGFSLSPAPSFVVAGFDSKKLSRFHAACSGAVLDVALEVQSACISGREIRAAYPLRPAMEAHRKSAMLHAIAMAWQDFFVTDEACTYRRLGSVRAARLRRRGLGFLTSRCLRERRRRIHRRLSVDNLAARHEEPVCVVEGSKDDACKKRVRFPNI